MNTTQGITSATSAGYRVPDLIPPVGFIVAMSLVGALGNAILVAATIKKRYRAYGTRLKCTLKREEPKWHPTPKSSFWVPFWSWVPFWGQVPF